MQNISITVLSLFDGMSCGQIALNKLGIKVKQYYASEIDKYAMQVTQHNFPDTIQLGDVRNVHGKDLPKIDLLIGGSPCQGFSFAGKGLNFNDPRSALFFEFVRLMKETQPTYFMLENVKMKKEHELVISQYMNVAPIEINSALLSAQNRVRLYWTNINQKPYGLFGDMISDIPQPKDKGILLKDILETEVADKFYLSSKMLKYVLDKNESNKEKNGFNYNFGNENSKTNTILSRYGKDGKQCLIVASRGRNPENPKSRQSGLETEQMLEPRFDGKTNCITSVQKDNLVMQLNHNQQKKFNPNINADKANTLTLAQGRAGSSEEYMDAVSKIAKLTSRIRRLTPTECERLQTVPDGYTSTVSDTQRYRMLGNGWTVDVIAYIFSFLKM